MTPKRPENGTHQAVRWKCNVSADRRLRDDRGLRLLSRRNDVRLLAAGSRGRQRSAPRRTGAKPQSRASPLAAATAGLLGILQVNLKQGQRRGDGGDDDEKGHKREIGKADFFLVLRIVRLHRDPLFIQRRKSVRQILINKDSLAETWLIVASLKVVDRYCLVYKTRQSRRPSPGIAERCRIRGSPHRPWRRRISRPTDNFAL